jgi:multicomponent Na+:H+ antiporter subunit G
MTEVFIILGLFFLTIGTLGLLKLSDTLERMHATSEATTLGVGFTVIAGAIKFYPDGAYLSAILALIFLFITAPTGAHMIARATYSTEENKERGETLKRFLKN